MKINKDNIVELIKAAKAAYGFLETLTKPDHLSASIKWENLGYTLDILMMALEPFGNDLCLTESEWDQLGDE